jgi:hypothetical protein
MPTTHFMPPGVINGHRLDADCWCAPSLACVEGVHEYTHHGDRMRIEARVVSDEVLAQDWSDPGNWAKTVTT